MRIERHALIVVGILLAAVASGSGMVATDSVGRWPADWPKGLEELRAGARTIEVANGTQENIYEIRFADRASFEKAWPVILSVKTPGAPLRLTAVDGGDTEKKGLLVNDPPMVRIYGPAEGDALGKDGAKLHAGAPWPKELYGPKGELPEWVMAKEVDGKMKWVTVGQPGSGPAGFYNRARVDVELVVDGKIIDLNRIKLPEDTPIVDERF